MTRSGFNFDELKKHGAGEDFLARARACSIASGFTENERAIPFDRDSECGASLLAEYAAMRRKRAAKVNPLPPPRKALAKRLVPKEPRMIKPGDLVKFVLEKLGIKTVEGCGCNSMRGKMNQWGYVGCFHRRNEIAKWFKGAFKQWRRARVLPLTQ